MVRTLGSDPGIRRKHAARRFAECDGDDALPLRQSLAGAQVERHPGPAPVIDRALQRDERLGVRLRVDARLVPVTGELASDDVARCNRGHAAEDLVLLLADGHRLKGRGRLHRHEGENLKQVRNYHVAISANRLVKTHAHPEVELLGHVDLYVVDEIAVPDRLEQAIRETKGEDVLSRLLAEEMIDPEDLFLAEDLVQVRIQRHGAWQI